MSIQVDYFRLAVVVLLGGILGSMIQLICIALRRPQAEPQATPVPSDPGFDVVVLKGETMETSKTIATFQPVIKYDIDVMFDDTVGAAVEKKIDAKLEAEQTARISREKLEPVKQAFEHLIKTRKPMVQDRSRSHDRKAVKLLEISADWSGQLGASIAFHFDMQYVGVRWYHHSSEYVVTDSKFSSYLIGTEGNRIDETYKDWNSAFKKALEFISPHILGYDGKSSVA